MFEKPISERIREFRDVALTENRAVACNYFLNEVMGAKDSLPPTVIELRTRLDEMTKRTVEQILGTQIFALSAMDNIDRLPEKENDVKSVLEMADSRCRLLEYAFANRQP